MRRLGALAFAVVALAACATSSMSPSGAPSPATTDRPAPSDLRVAPDFTLPTFSGSSFKLSDHAGKLPVVLNFWAPW